MAKHPGQRGKYKPQSHCIRGHPLDPDAEGADVWMSKRGPVCRHCRRIVAAATRQRARETPPWPLRQDRISSREVLREWEHLQPISRTDFARRMMMTVDAVDQALKRAYAKREKVSA